MGLAKPGALTDSSKDRNKKADVKKIKQQAGGASISKRTGLSSALKARLIRNTASEKSFSGGSFRDHMQQVRQQNQFRTNIFAK